MVGALEAAEIANGRSESNAAASRLRNALVWMDLEMTARHGTLLSPKNVCIQRISGHAFLKHISIGLDPDTHQILEIAVVVTDGKLAGPHLEGPDLIIHQPEEVLEGMNDWSRIQHEESGLTQRCRESTVSLAEAESQVLAFIEQYTEAADADCHPDRKAYLAGSSVYVDRSFLRRHMPRVHAHLHHRLVDVSTVAEIARRWFPSTLKQAPKKKKLHTAMSDIRESINELKFYRRTIFRQTPLMG